MTGLDRVHEIYDRQTRLLGIRALKMAASTHAYVRGNTEQFYRWLAGSKLAGKLPKVPPVWICGDCHIGNLGPIADCDGNIEIQIRDLDQTVISNPAFDLIRLGLSLATAARGAALPGVTTAQMIEQMVEGYEHALGRHEDSEDIEPNVVRAVKRRALGRRWKHLAQERIADEKPAIPLGKKFWPLDPEERKTIEALFESGPIQALVRQLDGRRARDRVTVIDAAYWVKGCSSLGNLRYAVLVAIGGTKRKPEEYALFDIKEAVRSVAPTAAKVCMPTDNGLRVVTGAEALAPNLGSRMIADHLLGRPVFVRELLPQDLKIELEQFSSSEAKKAARHLAYIVGHAHARQMNVQTREFWLDALTERRGGTIEAPSWLWHSVVEQIGLHEAAYLEHCRKFALSDAA
ncbi:DUF2252 family protein [Sphingomonas sp. AP4-R1]|uniref:DUF2252 family protein n=1 Tax=Sphingomonas sp. AP4-R1 TaxID=2735134 RepID=UPI0034631494